MVYAVNLNSESNGEALSPVKFSRDKQVEMAFADIGFLRKDNALYVVNTQESESDTARMTEADLRKAFALLAPDDASEVNVNTEVKSIKKRELWPWLAALMVVLLVFEFGLSNRTPP
jgi:hypothetical protein